MILTKEQALSIIQQHGIQDSVVLVGVRDKDNKINIYDDAIALVTPDSFDTYTANTDPSVTRKGVAVLQPGIYLYKRGLHGISHLNLSDHGDKAILDALVANGHDHTPIPGRILPYWALRQAGPVTLRRQGQTENETEMDPNNWPWIDIHKGGYSTTSSLGCQTVQPDLWPEFRDKTFNALKKYGQTLVKYCLIQA